MNTHFYRQITLAMIQDNLLKEDETDPKSSIKSDFS